MTWENKAKCSNMFWKPYCFSQGKFHFVSALDDTGADAGDLVVRPGIKVQGGPRSK